MPTFATPEPIDVTIEIVGDVRITASDRTDTVVAVRPNNPSRAGDVRAAEQTTVELAGGRLLVKTPRNWRHYTPFGAYESVDVTVELPTGSAVVAESGMGKITTDGELGTCRIKTAMGNIRLDQTGQLRAVTSHGDLAVDRVEGDAELTTGSGDISVEQIDGAAVVRNSNGDTSIGVVTGDLRVKAANGDITVDRADASATAKTANGDVRIAEVVQGTVVHETAAGEVEVGVREGAAAWLDAHTRFGTVRNGLDDADGPGSSASTVEVRARSSAGDIVIRRALSTQATRSDDRSEP
jgi:DUF4097 and DUF4098 domain-containing protein YvlB